MCIRDSCYHCSSQEAEAQCRNTILHPLASLEWNEFTKLPFAISSCDKVQAVYVPHDQHGRLYISAGEDLYFWRTNPDDSRWRGPHNFPKKLGLFRYALAAYHSSLALVGGWSRVTKCSDQVWILSASSSGCKLLPSQMLTKRSSAVAVGDEDYLAVAGGRNEEEEFLTVVEVYNGTQWMVVQPLPKSLRGITSVLHDGIWYLMEEVDHEGAIYYFSLEKLVSSKDSAWKLLNSSLRSQSAPVSFDGQLLVTGRRWQHHCSIHTYSLITSTWASIAPLENADKIKSMIGLPGGQLMTVFSGNSAVKIATVKGMSTD